MEYLSLPDRLIARCTVETKTSSAIAQREGQHVEKHVMIYTSLTCPSLEGIGDVYDKMVRLTDRECQYPFNRQTSCGTADVAYHRCGMYPCKRRKSAGYATAS